MYQRAYGLTRLYPVYCPLVQDPGTILQFLSNDICNSATDSHINECSVK